MIQRQIEVAHLNLTAGVENYSVDLHLDFVPTACILRTIAYTKNGGTGSNDLHGIKATWANHHHLLGTFVDDNNGNFISNPGSYLDLKNSGGALMNGQISFEIVKLTNSQITTTAVGVIALTFEFIKEYEEETPKVSDIDKLLFFLKSEKASKSIYPFGQIENQSGKGCCGCMRGCGDIEDTVIADEKKKENEAIIIQKLVEKEQKKAEEQAPSPEVVIDDVPDVEIEDTRNALDQGEPPIPNIHIDTTKEEGEEGEDGVIV